MGFKRSSLGFAGLAAVASLLGGCGSLGTTSHYIQEFALPSGSAPKGIVGGPDGNLWIVESGSNKVAQRITTTGAINEFPIPTAACGGNEIAVGTDGNLYFTETAIDKVAQVTMAGAITEFPLTGGSQPTGIAAGPDGAMWITSPGLNSVTRFDLTTHAVTDYNTGITASAGLGDIAKGADGNMWFTETTANNVARITTTGTVTEFPLATAASSPVGIAPGPDSAMWVMEKVGNKVAHIPTTSPTAPFPEYNLPSAGALSTQMIQGSDGNLWYMEPGLNRLGQMLYQVGTGGEASLLTPNANASYIGAGSDGFVWWSETGVDKIGNYHP